MALGRRVTTLGVLFDFIGNDVNTIMQKAEDMVNEQWFLGAIQDEPDLFLLAGWAFASSGLNVFDNLSSFAGIYR